MVTPQVIANLDSMDTIAPLDQRIPATSIGQRANHGKVLDIEPLEKLLDSRLVGLDVLRTSLPLRQVKLHGRLEWMTQRCCAIGERLVRDEGRQRFDRALRLGSHLIHILL